MTAITAFCPDQGACQPRASGHQPLSLSQATDVSDTRLYGSGQPHCVYCVSDAATGLSAVALVLAAKAFPAMPAMASAPNNARRCFDCFIMYPLKKLQFNYRYVNNIYLLIHYDCINALGSCQAQRGSSPTSPS